MLLRFLLATLFALAGTVPVYGATYAKVLGKKNVGILIHTETERFARQFFVMTKARVDVQDDYYPAVIGRVLEIDAPYDKAVAARTLRIGYGSFLSDITAFLLATTHRINLGGREVADYLRRSAEIGRCGRIPCVIACPSACDRRCNPCK